MPLLVAYRGIRCGGVQGRLIQVCSMNGTRNGDNTLNDP